MQINLSCRTYLDFAFCLSAATSPPATDTKPSSALPSTTNETDTSTSHKSVSIGAIAGASISGAAGVAILVGLLLLCIQRGKDKNETLAQTMLETTAISYNVERTIPNLPPWPPNSKHSAGRSPPQMSSAPLRDYVAVDPNAERPSFGQALEASTPSSSSTLSMPAAAPPMAPEPPAGNVSEGINTVPGLVSTINELLSRLPRGSVHGEAPPMYGE